MFSFEYDAKLFLGFSNFSVSFSSFILLSTLSLILLFIITFTSVDISVIFVNTVATITFYEVQKEKSSRRPSTDVNSLHCYRMLNWPHKRKEYTHYQSRDWYYDSYLIRAVLNLWSHFYYCRICYNYLIKLYIFFSKYCIYVC